MLRSVSSPKILVVELVSLVSYVKTRASSRLLPDPPPTRPAAKMAWWFTLLRHEKDEDEEGSTCLPTPMLLRCKQITATDLSDTSI